MYIGNCAVAGTGATAAVGDVCLNNDFAWEIGAVNHVWCIYKDVVLFVQVIISCGFWDYDDFAISMAVSNNAMKSLKCWA